MLFKNPQQSRDGGRLVEKNVKINKIGEILPASAAPLVICNCDCLRGVACVR